MLTKMTEADWAVALEVFRASLPRRGDKGRDDRLFLEALQCHPSVNNITWRGLPGSAMDIGTVSGSAFPD
ncbi:hypothetical protein ACQZ4O_26055 [Agrobacterium vitis]